MKLMSRTLTACLSIAAATLGLAITFVMVYASAAGTVYVDKAGTCGGNSPCFTSVQLGVNNSSADTTLLIFPGTYIESVDLAQMGSAASSAAGNLTMRTVNANAASVPGTVKLTPLAGPALYTSEDFAGNIALDGFEFSTAAGADGLNLDVAGNVTLKNIFGHDIGDEGINLNVKLPADQSAPAVNITNSTVQNSSGDGYRIRMVTGTLQIANSTATANGSDGFDLDTDMGITLTNVTAADNGKSGILARDATRVYIKDSVVRGNVDDGVDIDTGVDDVRIEDSKALDNGDDGFDLRAKDDVRIYDSTAADNAEQGFELGANDNVEVHNATASGNGLDGIGVYTYTNPVNDIQIEGNLIINNNQNRAAAGGIGIYADLRDSGDFSITSNAICDNNIAGLYVDSTVPMTPTLSAQGNWWGSAEGPNGSNNRISDAPNIVVGSDWISTASMQPTQVTVVGTSQVNVQFTDASGNWKLFKGLGDKNEGRSLDLGVSFGRIIGAAGTQNTLKTIFDSTTQSVSFEFDPTVSYPSAVSVDGPCGLSFSGELQVVNDSSAVVLVSAETAQPTTPIALIIIFSLTLALTLTTLYSVKRYL